MSKPEEASRKNADQRNNTSESRTGQSDFNKKSPSLRDRSNLKQTETPSQMYGDSTNNDRTTVDLNFSAATMDGLKP
jgi:hypothetical protein